MSVPALEPAFLALPSEGDDSFPSLARKLRILALRQVLLAPADSVPGPRREALGRLQRFLTSIAEHAPDALLDAIGTPDVLTLLLVWRSGLGPAEDSLLAAVPALLAALARTKALETVRESILWDAPVASLVDARGGRSITFVPPARALLANASGLEVELGSGRRLTIPGAPGAPASAEGVEFSRPFHELRLPHGRLHLSLLDTNPLAMIEDHPQKSGNAVSLGGRPAGDWVRAMDGALALVAAALPSWFAELPHALERVVPVGCDAERHLSASYREAPRLAYLSLHPDPVTMAEALVHETQHTKLNTLAWFDPVLHNAWTSWTASPVRPDLRPLMGVLMAAHAFVPVAALHFGLAEAGHPLALTPTFAKRRAQVLASNARALAVLDATAEPTAIGARLLRDLGRLHADLARAAPDHAAADDDQVEPA
jgi:HEXXH motif-containing protein